MATDYHAVIQENIQKQNGTYEVQCKPVWHLRHLWLRA